MRMQHQQHMQPDLQGSGCMVFAEAVIMRMRQQWLMGRVEERVVTAGMMTMRTWPQWHMQLRRRRRSCRKPSARALQMVANHQMVQPSSQH